jgi:hypothetical protein
MTMEKMMKISMVILKILKLARYIRARHLKMLKGMVVLTKKMT